MYKLGIRVGVMAAAVALAVGCGGGKSDDKHNDGGISAQASDKAGSGSPGGYITPSERTGSQPPVGSGAVAHASSPGAHGSTAGTGTLTAAEHEFLTKASTSGHMEVELGRLAATKATSPEVKKLGERIALDHENANRELQAMMASGHATSGVQTPAVAPDHAAARSQLEGLSGANFDRAYADLMTKHHQQAVADFEHAVQSMQEPVRSFAQRTLPTLRVHLEMSQQLQKQVGQRGQ